MQQMNTRRTFFKQIAFGAAAFGILPAATTYERIWKPKMIVPVSYHGELTLEFLDAMAQQLEGETLLGDFYYRPIPTVEIPSFLPLLMVERERRQYA